MSTGLLSKAISRGKELKSEEDKWKEAYSECLLDESSEVSDEKVEIKVGDICKVMSSGNVYLSYDEFAINSGHPDIVKKKYVNRDNVEIISHKKVRVLYVKRNPNEPKEDTIAIVETINNNDVYLKFLMNIKGLMKLTTDCNINLLIEAYKSGKKLNETIPDEYVNELFIKAIIDINPMDIQYVNRRMLTDNDYGEMIRLDGGLLGLIPKERISVGLCRIAIAEEEYAIKFVPEKFKSLV